ncbi:Probable medium-chain specific acyl-CoA dehydrogenase, mitochondrial [Gryllus bimaculatus]|nr:Probable medium-chain specific acyl-CoA dehydrogenase, mitochondrial [Gryllus bimaculatus]
MASGYNQFSSFHGSHFGSLKALEIDRLKDLENKIVPVETAIVKDASNSNSREMLKELKALGFFGLQVPHEYGGLNLNATEYARFCEIISQNVPLAISLNSHQTYGVKGLLLAGNKQQKQEYLSRLASGEWTAAFCISEPSGGANPLGVDTKATPSEDGEKWLQDKSKKG